MNTFPKAVWDEHMKAVCSMLEHLAIAFDIARDRTPNDVWSRAPSRNFYSNYEPDIWEYVGDFYENLKSKEAVAAAESLNPIARNVYDTMLMVIEKYFEIKEDENI